MLYTILQIIFTVFVALFMCITALYINRIRDKLANVKIHMDFVFDAIETLERENEKLDRLLKDIEAKLADLDIDGLKEQANLEAEMNKAFIEGITNVMSYAPKIGKEDRE